MNRDSIDWTGPMPALITPFNQTGEIDAGAFRVLVDRMFDAGATGILAGGCTGEFWALSTAEKRQLMELSVAAVNGRGTVLVGTSAPTQDEVIANNAAAREIGCDGAVVLPSYFIKLTDDEIISHYQAISDAVDLPICLYNIPANSVNAIPPGLARRLAEVDHVVAIKESCGDWNNFYATLLAVKDVLRVFCGPSSIYGVPAVLAGADGAIDCFPNVWLPGGIDLFHAAKDGRLDEAEALQVTGRRLTDLFTSGGRTLYPATKAAMDMLGYSGGDPRPPLLPIGPGSALDELAEGLAELGILAPQSRTRNTKSGETA